MVKKLIKLSFLFAFALIYLSFLHSLFSIKDESEDEKFCHLCPNEEYI